jgi:hypothetical protein
MERFSVFILIHFLRIIQKRQCSKIVSMSLSREEMSIAKNKTKYSKITFTVWTLPSLPLFKAILMKLMFTPQQNHFFYS